MSPLSAFRSQIDHFIGLHPQSPLTAQQQRSFRGLNYYEPNPHLVVTARVTRFPADEPLVEMATSTGDAQNYRRWGRATFEVNGAEAALTIYSDPHGRELFLPFKDATNGEETYGAGRYLDSHRPGLTLTGNGALEIDFNYAYNPYCAYNEHYSCPLPPPENWLTIPIRAGEKRFK